VGSPVVAARVHRDSRSVLLQWSTLPFVDLALEIMSLFVPEEDVPRADLHDILKRSFGTFRDEAVTPVVQVTRMLGRMAYHAARETIRLALPPGPR
jgi:threonine synthase